MNKAELISHLAERVGVTRKQAEDILECLMQTITEKLANGEEVVLAGFGAFSAKTRAPRLGVNPQAPTEKMKIEAVTVAKFKAGANLKTALKHTGAAAKPAATTPNA